MNLKFVFKLAWRETRASRRRLSLLVGSVAAGVAALVAINGFTDNLRTSVSAQAKALLGADVAISGRKAFPDQIERLVDPSMIEEALAFPRFFLAAGDSAMRMALLAPAQIPSQTHTQ